MTLVHPTVPSLPNPSDTGDAGVAALAEYHFDADLQGFIPRSTTPLSWNGSEGHTALGSASYSATSVLSDGMLSPPLTPPASKNVKLEVWTKTVNGPTLAAIISEYSDAGGTTLTSSHISANITQTGAFQVTTLSTTLAAGTASYRVGVVQRSSSSGIPVYLDDVLVTEGL